MWLIGLDVKENLKLIQNLEKIVKPVIIIATAVGISVVSIFVISEIIWYFANQEFEQARNELKENLTLLFGF